MFEHQSKTNNQSVDEVGRPPDIVIPSDLQDLDVMALASGIWQELEGAGRKLLHAIERERTVHHVANALTHIHNSLRAEKNESWTVAVDLTTDFGSGYGVASRLTQLRELAEKTKGKSVTFVVQAAIPDKPVDPSPNGDKTKTVDLKIERYIIQNGNMTKLETVPSGGLGDNLQALLSLCSKTHPSSKLALVLDSHGLGNEGVSGDTGSLGVDELVEVVKKGLKGSDRTRLDLINFDSCLMSQNGVLQRIKQISTGVVASTEIESGEGQNLIPPLEILLDKPARDGVALGRDIIEATRRQAQEREEKRERVPIKTLAFINLREYEGFRAHLDRFGDKLAAMLGDKNSNDAICKAIDETKLYGSSVGLRSDSEKRDLKEFTDRVIAAAENGAIKDPDGEIRAAGKNLLLATTKLVESYYGHAEYKNHGGVTVFLPHRDLRNLDREARRKNSAGKISLMTEPDSFNDINKTDETRLGLTRKIIEETGWMRAGYLKTGTDDELKELDNNLANFTKAKSDQERKSCLIDLHEAALKLENAPYFKQQRIDILERLQRSASKVFRAQLVEEQGGWNKLRRQLSERPAR